MTTCTFHGTVRCRAEATVASKTYRWRREGSEAVYAPRCKRHASVDRRRSYDAATTEPITPELQARWDREAVEREKRRRLEAQEKAARDAVNHSAYLERRREEAAREMVVIRDDAENLVFSRGEGLATTYDPRWKVQPANGARAWGAQIEVTVKRSDEPTFLEVRNSSKLDINEAKGLIAALQAAIEEATR